MSWYKFCEKHGAILPKTTKRNKKNTISRLTPKKVELEVKPAKYSMVLR